MIDNAVSSDMSMIQQGPDACLRFIREQYGHPPPFNWVLFAFCLGQEVSAHPAWKVKDPPEVLLAWAEAAVELNERLAEALGQGHPLTLNVQACLSMAILQQLTVMRDFGVGDSGVLSRDRLLHSFRRVVPISPDELRSNGDFPPPHAVMSAMHTVHAIRFLFEGSEYLKQVFSEIVPYFQAADDVKQIRAASKVSGPPPSQFVPRNAEN